MINISEHAIGLLITLTTGAIGVVWRLLWKLHKRVSQNELDIAVNQKADEVSRKSIQTTLNDIKISQGKIYDVLLQK